MKRVGFYRELAGGSPTDPSIFDAPRGEHPDREALLEYLQFGELHVGCPGVVRDVYDPSGPPVAAAHELTDGMWVWPVAIAYYVLKYGLLLDEDFVAHARSRGWTPARRDASAAR